MKQGMMKIGAVGIFVTLAIGVWQSISYSAITDVAGTNATLPAKAFSDIEGHWAKPSIELSVAAGYVDGYEDHTFRPDQSVTRAEFVKMVVTALKLPVSAGKPGTDWYLPYANAAVSGNVHQWSDFNNGDWNTPMTREEMARIAVRASGQLNEDAKKWMYLATTKGLIQGMNETGLLGEGLSTNRAQSVTIIERILTVRGGGTLPVDKHAVSRAEVVWHKTNVFTVMPQFFGSIEKGTIWKPDEMFVETPDGLYRGEMDAIVAIDLEDPNDPFLELLPDLESLRWHNLLINYDNTPDGFSIGDYRESYILYFKGKEIFNRDSTIYADKNGFLPFTVLGVDHQDPKSFSKGFLNATASVFLKKISDVPAFIFPKKLNTRGYLHIEILAPARAPNPTYSKTILESISPKVIK